MAGVAVTALAGMAEATSGARSAAAKTLASCLAGHSVCVADMPWTPPEGGPTRDVPVCASAFGGGDFNGGDNFGN